MTQFNPIRVGLIGAGGRWGPRAHAPALKGVPEAELYAVCTAHADTAQAAADKLGVMRAYGNDKELNADTQVEAVAVAVRVPAHYELTKHAIEAGKHVFCEWPLGANTKEAEIWRRWRAGITFAPWSACSGAGRPLICTCAS